jgi:hypothetical protein
MVGNTRFTDDGFVPAKCWNEAPNPIKLTHFLDLHNALTLDKCRLHAV